MATKCVQYGVVLTFQCDSVLLDRVNSSVGDDGSATLKNWRDADLLPLNGHLCLIEPPELL